ncbi:MAG: tetratricopeptide repeat protein, partial [Sandaracinaceae bacterium]|nr:tetratricopeptide repeat protein [Sandaracinaceae bacterium]
PYADNAHYWRGEIHFARRDYARAAAEMQRLIERYPNGNRVPDAMLRLGICLERLGETARARAVLQELRSRFPQSVAARMASREDA